MAVDPSGFSYDLHVPLEIIIGSIPLRSIAHAHNFAHPSAPAPPAGIPQRPEMPPAYLGAPKGLYSDYVTPSAVRMFTFCIFLLSNSRSRYAQVGQLAYCFTCVEY